MTEATRPVPLLGGISLEMVQRIEQSLDGGFASTPIAGLPGDLQQRSNRRSHHIHVTGVIAGDTALDDLKKLQDAATAGAELDFAADITSALDLQKVVIADMRTVETAGEPNRFGYTLLLVESPPLPPPARIGGFGGLDDFGFGDLGFDTGVLGDLADLAGDVAGAVDGAIGVLDALGSLANLDGLQVGGILQPMQGAIEKLGSIAPSLQSAVKQLADGFGGGA